ncbi:MAG: methyltransferase [Candidatus Brocadia sp. WS118]|nr:MAG: methyltransferase [Candidatus Brocadia sp. WS118]
MGCIKEVVKSFVPAFVRSWIRKQHARLKRPPPLGWRLFGSLRYIHPIRRGFGYGHGQCIDRYYIEDFLTQHTNSIHGRVLEIGDNAYTCRFGGERVSKSDVLFTTEDNPQATIIADLTRADNVPSDIFDCIILTQTLQFIYDMRAAIRTLYRILKPGGVLLATFPGISQISRYDMEHWGDYWRFTSLSASMLFTEVFPGRCVAVQTYGNVLTAIAFMHGLVSKELNQRELDYNDPDYEVLVTVRAVKSKN